MWIDLESVIQSEVSQKEKNKYCILTQDVEYRKTIEMNVFPGQEYRNRDMASWVDMWTLSYNRRGLKNFCGQLWKI